MTKDTGGQAFPRQESEHYHGMDGMTLRDYFAGQALTTFDKTDKDSMKQISMYCYEIADAMIAERNK